MWKRRRQLSDDLDRVWPGGSAGPYTAATKKRALEYGRRWKREAGRRVRLARRYARRWVLGTTFSAPYLTALNYARSLGLETPSQWKAWSMSGARPPAVPRDPQKVYAGRGWSGWQNWLGVSLSPEEIEADIRAELDENSDLLDDIEDSLRNFGAEPKDKHRVDSAFLPFTSFAYQAWPGDKPDEDEWVIYWVYGFSVPEYQVLLSLTGGRLCKLQRTVPGSHGRAGSKTIVEGLQFMQFGSLRATIVILDEQPGLSYRAHTLHFVAGAAPLISNAFCRSKRVTVIAGGGGLRSVEDADIQSAILARAVAAVIVPDGVAWDTANMTIKADVHASPFAELAALAIGCRFEGRADPARGAKPWSPAPDAGRGRKARGRALAESLLQAAAELE